MKSFSQFIIEVATQASEQAKRMGLKGDGHGDYYDRDGNLVAKTVNGRLKFFGKQRPPTPQERVEIGVQQQQVAAEQEKLKERKLEREREILQILRSHLVVSILLQLVMKNY